MPTGCKSILATYWKDYLQLQRSQLTYTYVRDTSERERRRTGEGKSATEVSDSIGNRRLRARTLAEGRDRVPFNSSRVGVCVCLCVCWLRNDSKRRPAAVSTRSTEFFGSEIPLPAPPALATPRARSADRSNSLEYQRSSLPSSRQCFPVALATEFQFNASFRCTNSCRLSRS